MTLTVSLPYTSYDVVIERGALDTVDRYLSLDRRVLIVTDEGVPEDYANAIKRFLSQSVLVRLPEGEGTKSLASFEQLIGIMLENSFTRRDCVVAVGGGVIGDLAGFVASAYMRGVDFYNIPTTLLSEVDASIGGKTALNFGGIKNPLGAFYQPKKVIIDPNVLKTLPPRQIASGLAECIKMALTLDRALFETIEQASDPLSIIDEIIYRSLLIKKRVVEEDEKETGLRRVLNFGHTIGHAIESENTRHGLYHGECVALGMLPMSAPGIRDRLLSLYKKLSLPTAITFDKAAAFSALCHDKKGERGTVRCIVCDEIGSFSEKEIPYDSLKHYLDYFG